MERRAYLTDLSNPEWECLVPLLPPVKPRGRPRLHPLRKIMNAILYVLRTGCQWRLLPHEFPPWRTAYHYFRLWRLNDTWQTIHTALREQLRAKMGRDPQPSAGILDSQTIKTTVTGGIRGYDGAKKMNGRKRHLLVDTLGLVLKAKVHSAALQDRAAVPLLLARAQEQFPQLSHVWVDQGYTGTGRVWIETHLGWSVAVVHHPPKPRGVWAPIGAVIDWEALRPRGFRGVLPHRWVVERTFSWLVQSRRLSKDYERLCETSEALIYAVMSRLMVRRLARS